MVLAASLEPRPFEASSFRAFLESMLLENKLRLPEVRGNLLIHVAEGATWTVVTKGPQLGVHDGFLEGSAPSFGLKCEASTLEALMSGADFDLEAELAAGRVELAGDVRLFIRFLALLEPKNMLALRVSNSGAEPKRAALRRR